MIRLYRSVDQILPTAVNKKVDQRRILLISPVVLLFCLEKKAEMLLRINFSQLNPVERVNEEQ